MSRGDRRGSDITSEMAIGDVSGDSLLMAVSSRIPDQEERRVFLAHVALGISIVSLERQVGVGREVLAARIDAILAALRQDTDLLDALKGISRAGRDALPGDDHPSWPAGLVLRLLHGVHNPARNRSPKEDLQ